MVLSFDVMLALVTAMAAATSLLTQLVKSIFDAYKKQYASNVIVAAVSVIVGGVGTALYYVNYQIPFNALTSVYLAIMCLLNCAGAMVGYDKVKQAITQIRDIRM